MANTGKRWAGRIGAGFVCAACLPWLCAPPATAQNETGLQQPTQQVSEPPAADPALAVNTLREQIRPQLTADALKALKAAYLDDPTLDPEIRKQIESALDRAIESMVAADRAVTDAAHFQEEIDGAQALLNAINAELAEAPPDVTIGDPSQMPLAEQKQQQTQAEAALRTARDEAAKLDTERTRRETRKETLPTEIARNQQRLDELGRELIEAIAASDVGSTMGTARLLRLFAEEYQRQQMAVALVKEQRWIDARAGTLQARLAQAQRRVSQTDRKVTLWRQSVLQAEQAENARIAEAAQKQKQLMERAGAHPAVQTLAAEYADLAGKRLALTNQLDQARAELDRVESRYAETYSNFVESVRLVTEVGLTNTIGQILLARRADLPDLRKHRQAVADRQSLMSEALARSFQLEARVIETRDPGMAVQKVIDSLEPLPEATGPRPVTEEERQAIKSQVDRLIRDIYAAIVGTDGQSGQQQALESYTNVLLQLDHLETLLIRMTTEYSSFIDERVLWIRSSERIKTADVTQCIKAAGELIDPSTWKAMLIRLKDTGRRSPQQFTWTAFAAIGVLVSLTFRFRARRRLCEIARHVEKPRLNPRFLDTLTALALTIYFAAPAALMPTFAGSLALLAADASSAMAAAGQALLITAIFAFGTAFVRHVCRTDGLAAIHFGWGTRQVAAVRTHVTWLTLVVLPSVFATSLGRNEIITAAGSSPRESLARLGFIAGMLGQSVFAFFVFRPSGPVLRSIIARNRGGWIDRLRHIWFLTAWGVPLLLAILAGLGWFYTAYRLGRSLWHTCALTIALIMVYGLFQRWLDVAARRLAIEQARKRREAAASAAAAAAGESESIGEGTTTTTPVAAPVEDEHELVIPHANVQTLKLLRSSLGLATLLALYLIWSSVLPALTMLDRVELWPSLHMLPARQVEIPPILLSADAMPSAASTALQRTAAPAPTGQSPEAGTAGLVNTATDQTGRPADSAGLPVSRFSAAAEERSANAGEKAASLENTIITLGNLMVAIIIAFITFMAARNIPGVLEIMLLQRLPLDRSTRYAITTVARYVLVIVGVSLTFGAVGIGWSRIQWLVAALTFGLAFGLQEIFANFISGLILLLERPIRIGDTVTIGDINGTVSRIRMRATTITDWNLKELVVPNKEFITGQLINWSLSDPTIRLIIPVGVAYGSDVEAVRRTLLRIAHADPSILDEPEPRVIFMGFGESSLDFELRVFLPSIDYFVGCRDTLNTAIEREFRKAGLEIPFPQRDLHVRSWTPELVVQHSEKKGE